MEEEAGAVAEVVAEEAVAVAVAEEAVAVAAAEVGVARVVVAEEVAEAEEAEEARAEGLGPAAAEGREAVAAAAFRPAGSLA